MLWQPPLAARYTEMSEADLVQAIQARRAELGSQLVVLGHHYQQDAVIRFADFTGDSFKLSQLAAERVKAVGAKYVIFAGVHFMAESADILATSGGEGTAVILPDLSAGCSMADMANYDDTVAAWEEIEEVLAHRGRGTKGPRDQGAEERGRGAKGPGGQVEEKSAESESPALHSTPRPLGPLAPSSYRVVPICYMNSTAAIKSFCGEHGGAVCTSSNCRKILQWALAGGATPLEPGEQAKILFLPDQHLGRNTAAELGYDVDTDMALWNPKAPAGLGGLDEQTIQRATFLLWKGHCSVHKLFRPEHVDQIREQWPDVTVMVHPECDHEVVKKADISGSTEAIIKAIETAKPGSRWAIGTEVHLVNRLAVAAKERGVTARILSECQCLCTTMFRIDLPHLLWVMDNLAEGKVVNQISVHPEVKQWALVALNRMLEITARPTVAAV